MVNPAGKKSVVAKKGNLVKIETAWNHDDSTVPTATSEKLVEDGPATHTRAMVEEVCQQQAIPSDLELQLQEYFKDRPLVKPLPPAEASTVDIDLADPDEETWIIQVPATVNVQLDLIGKKLNLDASRTTIKNCSVPLESHVQMNSDERVIGLLAGSRVKSFVPTGFIRISQALSALDVPDAALKASNPNHISVPYPEDIRERHPLLGYDFNELIALPKRVQKQLSFARQKAALMYQTVDKSSKKKTKTVMGNTVDVPRPATSEQQNVVTPVKREQPVTESAPKSASKRKRSAGVPTEEKEVQMVSVIKQEPLSPKRKKSKKADSNEEGFVQTASVKKEVSVEDDISWLLNI